MPYAGNLFVVAAPSGAGKSSLVRAVLERDARVQHSISHTTRPPRGREVPGREYHFVSEREFDAMVAADGFVEWAHVHNFRYGTSRRSIHDLTERGVDVILEIDYQGSKQIKSVFAEALAVFILPPSWDELRARLERRGEDAPGVIDVRMKNAALEVAHVDEFDFVIINTQFEQALFDLQSIIHSRRLTLAAQRRTQRATFQALLAPGS